MAAIPAFGRKRQTLAPVAPYTRNRSCGGNRLFGPVARCPGDKLSSISAPSLTGPIFAKSHLKTSRNSFRRGDADAADARPVSMTPRLRIGEPHAFPTTASTCGHGSNHSPPADDPD